MKIFYTPQEFTPKYSSNNISLDYKYLISEENDKNNRKSLENQIFKVLRILDSENSDENIIHTILILYNLIYKNYNKDQNIICKNIDNILDILIQKIKILFENNEKSIKLIKYIFNILYKLCLIENLLKKISIKTREELIILLINTAVNKKIKGIYETNMNNISILPAENNNNIREDCKTIYKTINSIILYIMKNLDITTNILIIFNIIQNNRINSIELVEYSIRYLSLIIQNIKDNFANLKIDLIINEIQIIMNDIEIDEKNSKMPINELIINLPAFKILLYQKI